MYRLYLAHSRFLAWVGKKSSFFGHIINPFTDKAYSFKMTGYWPHFALHFKARVSASQQGFIVHIHHTRCLCYSESVFCLSSQEFRQS